MEANKVVTGAAVVVLMAVLGLIVIVGVILLMMWKQPGIEHSPSQSRLYAPVAAQDLSRDPMLLPSSDVFIPGSCVSRSEV